MHQIARGVLTTSSTSPRRRSARACRSPTTLGGISPTDTVMLNSVIGQIVVELYGTPGETALFEVVILDQTAPPPVPRSAAGPDRRAGDDPADLERDVQAGAQLRVRPADPGRPNAVKGLIYRRPGAPGRPTLRTVLTCSRLSNEDSTIALIQQTVLFAGLGLVLLVVLIAVLSPSRWSARSGWPRRTASGWPPAGWRTHAGAPRGRAGAAASSFNEMADQPAGADHQAGGDVPAAAPVTSDVSHELRTP